MFELNYKAVCYVFLDGVIMRDYLGQVVDGVIGTRWKPRDASSEMKDQWEPGDSCLGGGVSIVFSMLVF